jgi:hypothetical protein
MDHIIDNILSILITTIKYTYSLNLLSTFTTINTSSLDFPCVVDSNIAIRVIIINKITIFIYHQKFILSNLSSYKPSQFK